MTIFQTVRALEEQFTDQIYVGILTKKLQPSEQRW
jgi:hypothetical protein